jgi:oxygen-independent coproporphyrinogen-3 oxidase
VRRPLGIYVHVPFCRTRCRYCDFYRVGENRARMDRFVAALGVEIDAWHALHGRAVASVFFGGGTPSLLAPPEIAGVVERLASRFAFAPDVEITAEANPSDLDAGRLVELRAAGVNRLSLGAQSFVDRELSLLGRRHDAAAVARVVDAARAAGFDDLSLDLMVGIPAQTDGSFATSLARVVALAPDHVSLYLLEVHAGSEIDALRRERPRLFAGEEALRRRYLRMRERLATAGYRQYEISNFARPGRECRHNLGYWRCGDWLGLGPAAHSHVDGRRFRHPPDLERWLADPQAVEELPVEPAAERVFLGLRLAEGIETAWLADAGLAPDEIDRRLAKLAPFLARESGRLRLNADGYLVSNAVLAELLR